MPSRAVAAGVAALVALRLVHWLLAPPNSDEAYYWAWGQHPALSYYDPPGLVAWANRLVGAALGRSTLALRLPAALCTVGTLVVLARIATRLAEPGRGRAVAVAAAFLGSPLLLMLTSFAWPDPLLVFLSALSTSLLAAFLAEVTAGGRGSTARLLAGAAALGLAGLAKYSAVFVGIGVAIAVASDRRLRPLLRDARLWAAAGVALLAVSPVLVWNQAHGLASFRYHLVDRQGFAAGLHASAAGPVHFVVPTILLLSPTLAAAMVAALRAPAPASGLGATYRRVALAVAGASTAVFLSLSVVGSSQYYWNVVAYVVLLPPAALALAARPRLLRAHLAYGVTAAALLVAHATVIPFSAFFPWSRDEDSREPLGWSGIAAAVSAELRRGPGRFPATTDYRSGAHLAWALGTADVVVLSARRSEFDYWVDPARAGETAILVSDARAPMCPDVAGRFEKVTHLASVPVERLGVRIKTYELWAAEGFRPPAAATVARAGAR